MGCLQRLHLHWRLLLLLRKLRWRMCLLRWSLLQGLGRRLLLCCKWKLLLRRRLGLWQRLVLLRRRWWWQGVLQWWQLRRSLLLRL